MATPALTPWSWVTVRQRDQQPGGVERSLSLPTISGQPQSLNRTNGDSASFTVTASTVAGSLTYQWYFNTNVAQRPDGQHAHSLGVTNATRALIPWWSRTAAARDQQPRGVDGGQRAQHHRAAAKPQPDQRRFRRVHGRRHQQCGRDRRYQWYFNTNTCSGQTGSTPALLVAATVNAAESPLSG